MDPTWWNAAPGELYGDSYRFADEQEEDEEMGMGYIDEKCYELAKYFLSDDSQLNTEENRKLLAQVIQDGYWSVQENGQ